MIVTGGKDHGAALRLAARALQRLRESGPKVLAFSQSHAEHNLNLLVREKAQEHGSRVLRREFNTDDQDDALHLGVKAEVTTISVVGVRGCNGRENGIVSHAFAAPGQHSSRVIAPARAATERRAAESSTAQSVPSGVPQDPLADAVRFLHREPGWEGGDQDCSQQGTPITGSDR